MHKKILILGGFDVLHPGHLALINEARQYGEVHALVGLDATIRKFKGRDPIYPLAQRMKALEAVGVVPHAGHPVDRLKVIRDLDPEVILIGYDQQSFTDQLNDYVRTHKPKWHVIYSKGFKPEIFATRKIRAVLDDPAAGFILIDKESGEGSMRSVAVLRKITGIKQVGFAGTLDPLASGLLVCGISKATTLLDWWHLFPKTYVATARLGAVSDTYDWDGALTSVSDSEPTEARLKEALKGFVGTMDQTAPPYSAKKVEGTPMHRLARKGKATPKRVTPVTIHSIEDILYSYPNVTFTVICSTGTYVRSLVHDLGERLKTGAVLCELRRVAIGPYRVEDAALLSDLRPENVGRRFIDLEVFRERVNAHVADSLRPLDF